MSITTLTFVPPGVGVITLISLVMLLQYLLHRGRSGEPAVPITAAKASAASHPDNTWHAIRRRWNGWVTGVLPITVGVAAIAVGIWSSAYVGWVFVGLLPSAGLPSAQPPWFGNPGIVLAYALVGGLAVLAGALLGALFLWVAGGLGQELLWPEANAGSTGRSDDHGNDPSTDPDDDDRDTGDIIELLLGDDDDERG